MSVYTEYERDGLAGARAIRLCLYCAIAGCFASGLYELLQPMRSSEPPPLKVIAYGPPSGLPPPPAVPIPKPIATADLLA